MAGHHSEKVAGRLPVLAALQAGRRRPRCLYVYEHAKDLGAIKEAAATIPVEQVNRKRLDDLSAGVNHQGVVLQAAPLPVFPLDDWMQRHPEPEQALVMLDGVEDPQNFGAIIRSAAAFGAAGVLFAKDRASPITTAAMKAAAGGMEYVDLIQVTNLARALETLKKQGFWIAALAEDAEQPIWKADLRGRIALIIGNEGTGIRRLVKERADFLLSIPLTNALPSLNASVSAGIALAEWSRQR